MVVKVTAPEGAEPVRTGEGGAEPVRTGPGAVESLSALAEEARTLDAPPEPTAGQVAVAQAAAERERDRAAAELADVLAVLRDAAAPLVEDAGYLKAGQVRAIWDGPALERIAGPLVAIMERHGISLGEAMNAFGPYLMLFAGVGLPAVATVRAIRENRGQGGQPQPA